MPEAVVIALVALAGGIATAALGLVPAWLRRRSDRAEAADYISAAWSKLNEAVQSRLDDLEEENRELRIQATEQQKHGAALEKRLNYQSKEIDSLQRQLSANARLHNATIEALQTELDAERAERQRLEKLVAALRLELEAERTERMRLEELVEKLRMNGIRGEGPAG